MRRSRGGDVVALYVAVSVYVAFDVCVFHLLSGWLTVALEAAELAPICIGALAYRRMATGRGLRWSALPRVVVVPVVATVIQLEMLACTGLYRCLSPT